MRGNPKYFGFDAIIPRFFKIDSADRVQYVDTIGCYADLID